MKKPKTRQKFKRQTLLTLTLILTLIHQTTQICQKGCLKCTYEDKCILCDTTESFKLEDTQCKEFKPANCNKIDLSGNCFSCSSGHYLDSTDKTCKKVDIAKQKSKCTVYDSSMNCAGCKRDYYVNSGNCLAVTSLIKNCEINQTEKLCKECEKNYLLSLDRKSCIPKSQISNCQYWSTVICKNCKPNFIENRNLYFTQWYRVESSSERMKLLEKIYKFKFGFSEMQTNNVCQLIEIQHCLEYRSFDTCGKCEKNFFLNNDKKCQAYPKEKIKFCQIYESANNCVECQQGYYLKNNICAQVTEITNCAKYDPRESSSKCIECAADYILSGTTCTKRQSSDSSNIANCKTKHLTEDKCEGCQENYVISTDGLKCFAAISNCQIHAQVGSTSQNFQCKTCNDDYFLNDKTCETGSVSNCKVFTAITTCKECENQYFLANTSTCSKSNDIQNCLTYDGKNENAHHTCEQCTNNTFNFKIKKYCKDVDTIPNCKVYKRDATTATCQECNPGFYKVSDTTCNAFQDTNCTKGSGVQQCTHCNAQFALDLSNNTQTCRTPHEYMIMNCASHTAHFFNDLTIKQVECNYCKPNFFPWNVNKGFVCIKDKEYLTIESITGNNVVEGCHKYEAELNCIQCKETLVLFKEVNQVSCVSSCNDSNAKQINEIIFQNNGFRSYNANQCKSNVNHDNCAIFGSQVFSNYAVVEGPTQQSLKVCIKCDSSTLPIIPLDFSVKKFSSSNPESDTFQNLILDPLYSTPQVTCESPRKLNGILDPSQPTIQNCDLYGLKPETIDEVFCIKCNLGFYGKIKKTADNLHYIESCIQYDKCDINTIYYNLHPVYQISASCHKCNNNTIPFVPLFQNQSTFQIEGIREYDLSNENYQNIVEGSTEYSVKCIYPDRQSSFGNSGKFTTFPSQCGLGVINLSSTDGNSTDSILPDNGTNPRNLAIFCGACKPSYKPTFFKDNELEHIVIRCDVIDNCSTSNQNYFNGCSECSTGYAFLFDNNQIDYTNCTKHTSQNCYSAEIGNGNNGLCRICKRGYVMNNDFTCEELTAAKCTTSLGSVIQNGEVTGLLLNYMVYSIPQGNGCNACSSGYTALERISNEMVCSVSPYITQRASNFDYMSDETTKSKYIKNCEGYTLNYDAGQATQGTLKCMKCSSANILNQNGSNCLSTVPNCVLASSTNDEQCAECEEGYALINDTCQSGNIANCAQYETKLSYNTIKCKACKAGYFSDSNKTLCKIGIVPHCKVYIENNSKQCSECDEGYAKISKEVDICYPIEAQLNCKTAFIESKNDEVMCSDCKLPNQILEEPKKSAGSTENQTICMRHNLVENCDKYDLGKEISGSTFLCIKCKSGHYLKDYNCKKRDVLPPSCSVYEISENKCQQCASGNYLVNSGKNCETYPTGIIGCGVFTNEVTCQACKANRYLSNNQCTEVPQDSTIDNCQFYSSANTCSECSAGYVLNSGQCHQANAQNCETYTSIDACATCKANYGLKTENGKTNCISVNKANCIIFEATGLFKCQICNQNYFPNTDGECQIANPLILGCINYSSNDKCIQCDSTKALNEQGKCVDNVEIVEQIDPNCLSSQVLDQPICSACQPGYIFNEEQKCRSCSSNKIEQGCFSCDPNLNDTCLVCNTGYYMEKEGKCINTNPVTVNPNGPDSGRWIWLVGQWFMIVLAVC